MFSFPTAMKCVLDEKGDLAEVRAQLEEQMLSEENNTTAMKLGKPAMPPDVILANNLIRQYLEYVGLHKTSSVLCAGDFTVYVIHKTRARCNESLS